MEVLARDQYVSAGDERFRRRRSAVRVEPDAGDRVFRAARDSGVRGQSRQQSAGSASLRRAAYELPDGARQMFTAGRAALAAGDTAGAHSLLVAARDADVVRFRAPAAFDSVVQSVARTTGAVYVPVRERFDAEAPSGIPGSELFLSMCTPIGVADTHGPGVLRRVAFRSAVPRKGVDRYPAPVGDVPRCDVPHAVRRTGRRPYGAHPREPLALCFGGGIAGLPWQISA